MAPSPDFCLLPPTPTPPQAMVGSTSSRSFSISVAADDDDPSGSARVILKGAVGVTSTSTLRLVVPQRNGRTSRAVRSRAHAHPGLVPPHHVIAGDNHHHSNNSAGSLGGASGRPVSDSADSDSSPAAAPAATTRAPSSSVPVLAITCGAVGAIVALAIILALVYIRRIRRRVKSMKRRTNVLGPELAVPMSPSQSSPLTTIDPCSPRVKFDGNRVFPPAPRMTSELNNHLPPPLSLSAPSSLGSPTILELPNIPLSPIRTSTIILSPTPTAKRSSIRSSYPNSHHSNHPRSPIRTSRAAVPWPLITAPSSSGHPQHVYEERSTSSDASKSTHS